MTLARFYLHRGQVIIPTVARTEAGFYTDVEPVAVVDAADASLLKESMQVVLARQNPEIPTPSGAGEPGSVVLDALGLKKWMVFEKNAVLYTVQKRDDGTVVYATGRGADGMWIRQKDRESHLAAETSQVDLVETIYRDMLTQPEARPPAPPPLLMLMPPPPSKPQAEEEP